MIYIYPVDNLLFRTITSIVTIKDDPTQRKSFEIIQDVARINLMET